MKDNEKNYIRIKKDLFQKLWNSGITLFFFNKDSQWDSRFRKYITVWKPENEAIESKLYNDIFSNVSTDIVFIYGKSCESSNTILNGDFIEIEYEEFDPNNISHVKAVFHLHYSNRKNQQNKYACRELLWYLNNYYINFDLIIKVLNDFEATSYRLFFLSELKKYSCCLSIPKQNLIQRIVSRFGETYNIYVPNELLDALRIIDSNYNPNTDWKSNIFALVHKATYIGNNQVCDSQRGILNNSILNDNSISNFYLKIRRWLIDESYSFSEFDKLQKFIRLFSPEQQLLLLNRYFLAIKKQQTSFHIELLKQFKDNKFDNWNVYYHCVYRASKPILIGLQLLCDNLLTFLSTNGLKFQEINGILDLTYSQCNVYSPAVDFQLKNIVPICNGGAIYNNNFKGFICCEIIKTIDKNYFDNDDNIFKLAQDIITFCSNYRYYRILCTIHKENFSLCEKIKEKIKENNQSCFFSDCENYRKEYLNKWNFTKPSKEKCEIVNLFLKNKLITENNSLDIYIDDINTNTTEIRQNIYNFLDSHLTKKPSHNEFPEGYIYSDSCSYVYKSLYDKILRSVWMIIEPRNNAYIGLGLLASNIGVSINGYGANREQPSDAIKYKESEYIKPIIISSIKSIVNKPSEKDGRFCLKYDEKLLKQLQADLYSTKSLENGNTYNNDNDLCFLQRNRSTYVSCYCSPEYVGQKNKVINFPYFDCRGGECYLNALSEQTLETCNSWKQFNLLHMLEILGYPQIKKQKLGSKLQN